MSLLAQRNAVWMLCYVALLIPGYVTGQQTSPPSPKPLSAEQRLQQWRESRIPMFINDFGELSRYRAADLALSSPAPGEDRVVFLGDSITDGWHLADYFPGKAYINRGISGQTTPQMLVRFREDVIALHPKVVIILAGTNDIAGNTGPMTLEEIEGNYASMAELAQANNVHAIFSSVTPVNDYSPDARDFFSLRSPEKILELNRWLKDYCVAHKLVYLDYFSAMVDEKGLLKRDLTQDGLHPNPAGYRVMAPLASQAIEKAVGAGQVK